MKKFLVEITAPVVVIEEEPIFPNEAVPKQYVDELIALRGIPEGGVTGQALYKKSTTDFDVEWVTPNNSGSNGHCFPFILHDQTQLNIPIILGHLPFILSDGTQTGINIGAC